MSEWLQLSAYVLLRLASYKTSEALSAKSIFRFRVLVSKRMTPRGEMRRDGGERVLLYEISSLYADSVLLYRHAGNTLFCEKTIGQRGKKNPTLYEVFK